MANTWNLGDQTEGKHLVLRHYLRAWLPILGSWNKHLLLIDGFAGPGQYNGGQPGSPLIALDCVHELKAKPEFADVRVRCLFIESDPATAAHLTEVLASENSGANLAYDVLTGSFEGEFTNILDWVDRHANKQLAPAFVMVDPFGPKGVRMEFVERILAYERSECMLSFMWVPINRRKSTSQFEHHLDQLYGTREWRKSLSMKKTKPDGAKDFLHGLFARQLKQHGARFVVPFALCRGNTHVYTLFFTSGSDKGCDTMKKCMWKVDTSGNYTFRGMTSTKPTLFQIGGINDVKELFGSGLKQKFGTAWTRMEDIEQFAMGDETPFHSGQLRQMTLQPLERERRIEVRRPQGGRGFKNRKGIEVRFL